MKTRTNEEWIITFERYLKRRFPGRSTAKHYVSDMNCFRRQVEKSLIEVNRSDIDHYIDEERSRGSAVTTVKRRVMSLKSFYEFVKEELNEPNRENPVWVKRHAGRIPKQLPRDLRDEEVERLLAIVTDLRDRNMLLLMLYGGLRVEEVVNLKVAGLSDELKEGETTFKLRVRGKGRKERVVYLPEEVTQTVRRHLSSEPNRTDEQPLFLSRRGQKMSVAGVQWVLRQYAQQSGIPVTCHRLRHTCARWLAEGEMPLLSLSRFLGHSQLATTQRYIDGAAPQLRRHYTEAMETTETIIEAVDTASPSQAVTPTLGQATVIRSSPNSFQQPVWWTQMPSWWQKDVAVWVKHRWSQWKPSRRQKNAYTKVSNVKRFWLWQMERRPFSGWEALTTADVQQFIDAQLARNLAYKTVSTLLDDVYAILRWLLNNAQLSTLPKRPLMTLPDSLPKHLSPHQLLAIESYAQEQQLKDAPDWLTLALYYTLAHGGLRISEILDLQWRQIEFKARRLTIRQGKSRRDRITYLTQTAVNVLAAYMQTVAHTYDDLVFSQQQRPLSYYQAHARLRSFGLEAGIQNLSPLRLRHTYATTLLNNGVTLASLRLLLGHEQLTTTLIYARLADSTVEKQYQAAMQRVTNLNEFNSM